MTALILAALASLQGPLDQGTFVVRQDTVEVARETFQLSTLRIGPGANGWHLAARTRYDHTRPVVVLGPTLDVSSDSQPLSLDFEVSDPRAPLRIRGERARDRLTLRYLTRHGERAREVPLAGPTVILDDSVFAPYLFAAWRGDRRPLDLTAVVPRAERREVLRVEDLGPAMTTLNGTPAMLRHLRLTGGANEVVHLWLDANGLLNKIEIPSRRLRAERLPPA
jgi:hypothetical protein